jgi:hypothetical protein
MSSGASLEVVDVAVAHVPMTSNNFKDEQILEKRESLSSTKKDVLGANGEQYPTDEEWTTLRRVYGKVNWMIYIIGVVETCERFAYYGTTAVCKCTTGTGFLIKLISCSRQFHPTIPTNRRAIPRSWCSWNERTTRSAGHGSKSFHRARTVQSVLFLHHAYDW